MSSDGHRAPETVPMRLHPRVFTALGKELVTNDVVAVMELVKNAYDAFAYQVKLLFGPNADLSQSWLEIQDDGLGMTRQVIEEAWCMVATPYRAVHPYVRRNDKERRVVGAKGLGRLAAARLGQRLTMLTQAPGNPCWEVTVDWTDMARQEDIVQSTARCREYEGTSPFAESGTQLRIHALAEDWNHDRIEDLRDNLARLLSPFATGDDFRIFLFNPHSIFPEHQSRVESLSFLDAPKYRFQGQTDEVGNVIGLYQFAPIDTEGTPRQKKLTSSWHNIRESQPRAQRGRYREQAAGCGPFTFEIRAWDIGANDTQEISERFAIQKSRIREAIRAHKGLSVYRDGVLVLPKSDSSRDWLGLDLLRVTQVGPRLSTSQIVGYVAISTEHNPRLEDTSDRERLLASSEVAAFELILRAIVRMLERERIRDRTPVDRPMADLFHWMSADELVTNVKALAKQNRPAADVVPLVSTFNDSLTKARETLKGRFVYYSRLATVGTIALMLVHEIGNRTVVIGELLRFVKQSLDIFPDKRAKTKWQRARRSIRALNSLADRFQPLASRNFRQRKKTLILEHRIRECLAMNEAAIRNMNLQCQVPETQTAVSADPGEVDIIILNLVTNAIHWLGEVPKDNRRLVFTLVSLPCTGRVQVGVHDNGPGIDPDDLDLVFLPGVTRKPNGFGMGLNVAAELVAAYGGEMKTERPPTLLEGASFIFDLPLAKAG